jgi:hypothetical protein
MRKQLACSGWRNYTVCFDVKEMGIAIMTNSSNSEGIYKEWSRTCERHLHAD